MSKRPRRVANSGLIHGNREHVRVISAVLEKERSEGMMGMQTDHDVQTSASALILEVRCAASGADDLCRSCIVSNGYSCL